MRLADFILQEMEPILVNWEAFAATQMPAAASMNRLALRDHARQILEAVAKDLSRPQSKEEQAAKSLGQAPRVRSEPDTAAQTHAVLRAERGFDINQLVAEYRALRASVLRLWFDAHGSVDPDVDDVTRFNEAIDQALAESVAFFSAQVDQARDLLLGIVGHDLRTPLQTIQMAAAYLTTMNAGEKISEIATRMTRSSARMHALLNDLLDFNRSKLGLGISIAATDVDVQDLFIDELARLRIAHPGRWITLKIEGNVRGVWDGPRLQQILCNLVVNAIKYGSSDEPVEVMVNGADDELRFEVRNGGPAIDPSTLAQIFEPLIRGARDDDKTHGHASLGLGLYIAREIARSHGGTIDARSDNSKTVFTVRLPRRV